MNTSMAASKLARLEGRIAAVEHLIAALWARVYLSDPQQLKDADRITDHLRNALRDQSSDRAPWRDRSTVEMECALEHNFLLIEEIVQKTFKLEVHR